MEIMKKKIEDASSLIYEGCNSKIYFSYGDLNIYKILSSNDEQEFKNNILNTLSYLKRFSWSDRVIVPKDFLFENGFFYGYITEFFPSFTIESVFTNSNNNLTYNNSQRTFLILEQIQTILLELHQHLIVGDFIMRNLLISSSDKYIKICDFDFSLPKDNTFDDCYTFYKFCDLNKDAFQESQLIDCAKLLVIIISLIYNYNFEIAISECEQSTFEKLIKVLEKANCEYYIIDYITKLFAYISADKTKPFYPTFLSKIDLEKEASKQEALKRILEKGL